MTHKEYADHIKTFVAEMQEVTKAKNADYSAGTDDALNSYKDSAEAVGITPFQSWLVLFMKHVHAIQRYSKTGSVSSETIHGRFIDIANYAMLGDALAKELESDPQCT